MLCLNFFGALIIQKRYNYSDRELVEQLTENPYYQYFIGLHGFQEEPPFDDSTLVLLRKRLDEQTIMEANNYMLSVVTENESVNSGTVILDASCASVNVRFPQDAKIILELTGNLDYSK